MKISNSKANTWKRCHNKYRYKYVMGLRPKRKVVQLERGTWLHSLLEHHYSGRDWEARHAELSRAFFSDLFEDEREDLGDLPTECGRIIRSYLRYWEAEDSHWTVVDTELDEFITLPNGLRLNIVVDLVVEDHYGLWVVDHKSREKFGDKSDMLLDPQLTLYFWGLEQMGYRPLAGAIYNELRTKPPTIPKVVDRGRRLERRKNVDTDVLTYATAVKEAGFDLGDYSDMLRHIAVRQKDKFFRRTHLPKDPPVVKTMLKELVDTANEIQQGELKNRYPRSQDGTCKWQCEYRDLCLSELYGGDISSMIKSSFNVRKGHRKEEDEPKPRIKLI